MSSADPLSQAALDELWDFDDPAGTEVRMRAAIRASADAGQRAELVTQLARAVGLQGRYDEAAALLDEAEPVTAAGEVRCQLERGRVLNSSGRHDDAIPLFTVAATSAERSGLVFLAVDAWHMVAIADPAASESATEHALGLVAGSVDARTKRWEVSLHNNRGWVLHDGGRYDEALTEFEAAHRASLEVGTAAQEYLARWAIARCLRSLARHDDALEIQRRLADEDPSDPYVTEEIAALERVLSENDS